MKRDLFRFCTTKRLLICFLLAIAIPAIAQTTIVTGTVIDPNGIPYAGGTIFPQLVSPGGPTPTLNGAFFVPSNSPATLDANGKFSLTVQDNAQISPASTQWKFTVCSGPATIQPAAGKGSQCFSVTLTITGASTDISSQLQAAAPSLITRGIIAKADQTGQTNNVGNLTLLASNLVLAGTYRFTGYSVVTTAAATSSTLAVACVFYTDIDSNFVNPINSCVGGASTANTVGTVNFANGQQNIIQVKAGTTIQWSTQGYASVPANTMQYAVHVKLEYLGP